MREEELIRLAEEMGFSAAAAVDTGDVVFQPSFRPLCAENVCGKYGVNYACPPDCGTVEEMADRVRRYRRGLVLQTMWDIEDPMDEAATKPAKRRHNRMTREFIKRAGVPGLMVGAGAATCARSAPSSGGSPAAFPGRCSPACPPTASS